MKQPCHVEAFVEALCIRMKLARIAEMPLADMNGVVAFVLQHFGDRHFRARQALVREIGKRGGRLRVVAHLRPPPRFFIGEQGNDPPHAVRRRREFESCACRIAARQQHRARRRAGARAGIGRGEVCTARRQRINVRCRNAPARNAAAKGRYVVDAEVIHEDEDDVRRPVAWRSHGGGRSLHPAHRLVGRNLRPVGAGDQKQDDLFPEVKAKRARAYNYRQDYQQYPFHAAFAPFVIPAA